MILALPWPAIAQQEVRSALPGPPPLTLDAVIREATRAHPLILAAERRVHAARGGRITAGALGNPVVSYQVENTPFPGRENTSGLTRETSSIATLPLEPFWQRAPRVGRANEDILAAQADLVAVRRQVALEAGHAFHRTALSRASLDASADVIAGLDSLIVYTGTRVREGASAEGDLLRLEVERERALTEQAFQEAELAQATAALSAYLPASDPPVAPAPAMPLAASRTPGARDFSVTPLLDMRGLPDRSALADRALAQRPDIAAARARTRAAEADIGVQRALAVRQLGATFGNKSIGGTPSMIAGISLALPLFDRNRGEIQRTGAEHDAVVQELLWSERRATAEVVGAYDAATTLTARVTALDAGYLARASASRNVVLVAYREGAATLLQVLDATRTLAEARFTYLRARYAQQDAVLSLYVAAGLDPAGPISPFVNIPR